MEVTGIILAGGKSSRMREDKGLSLLNGRPMIQYAIDSISGICAKTIIIATNKAYTQFGIPVLSDIYPNKGPIGGIYTGLVNSTTDINIVMSCDNPFITEALLNWLLPHQQGNNAVLVSEHGRIHPLIGLYPTALKTHLKKQLGQNNLKVTEAIGADQITTVEAQHFEGYSPTMFSNINTPEERSKAENI